MKRSEWLVALSAAWWLVACSADESGVDRGRSSSSGGSFSNPGATGQGGSVTSDGDGAFGNTTVSGGAAGGGSTAGLGLPKDCATAKVMTSKVKPVVTFVIDGSASMCEVFGGQTRWQALRDALVGAGGVIETLQPVVSFGMTLYTGTVDLVLAASSGEMTPACALASALNPVMECPQLVQVAPALNNLDAIVAQYPSVELGGSTPTHSAMATVIDALIANQPAPSPDADPPPPQYVILATDGQPNDYCVGGAGADAQQAVLDAVTRGAQADIKTFVISLAGGDAALQAHLDQVAAAGNTGSAPFTPQSRQELVDVLTEIVGGAVGCSITLNGAVSPGSECLGFVEYNGLPLPCDDPNGWKLTDERTLELVGQACTDFLAAPGAQVQAGFPCGVFTPD